MEKLINLLTENMELFIIICILIASLAFLSLIIVLVKQKKSIQENDVEEELSEEKLVEQQKAKLELEEMVKRMEEDISNQVNDTVSTFEQEQEEKAIISYQELLSSVKGEKINTPKMNIEEVLSEIENVNQDTEKVEDKNNSKFKNTEFISPIFGKQENKTNYPKIEDFGITKECEKELFEPTIDIEKLDEQIRRNDEFLKALKEFRKNL